VPDTNYSLHRLYCKKCWRFPDRYT